MGAFSINENGTSSHNSNINTSLGPQSAMQTSAPWNWHADVAGVGVSIRNNYPYVGISMPSISSLNGRIRIFK